MFITHLMTDWSSPHVIRQNAVASNLLLHALLGIFYWEWIVSLDFDIAMLCGKRTFRWPMILYLMNRYGTLAMVISATVLYNSPSRTQDCDIGFRIAAFFGCMSLSISSLMLSIRTMAVWNRDRRVVIPLAILVLTHFALSLFAVIAIDTTWDTHLGCVPTDVIPPGPTIMYAYTVAFDSLILVLTGWKLRSLGLCQAGTRRQTKGLGVLLFKDGLVYFVVACVVNSVALVLSALNLNPVMVFIADPPANVITTIAACRVVRRLILHNEQANVYFSDLVPTISINEPVGIQRPPTVISPVEVELAPFRHTSQDEPSDDEHRHSDSIHPITTQRRMQSMSGCDF